MVSPLRVERARYHGRAGTALNRNIRYIALPLDAFEAGVDAAIGPGVGKQIGAIFRFIDRHPDDRAFVSSPFWASAGFPSFEPTSPAEWVAAHADAFSQSGQLD